MHQIEIGTRMMQACTGPAAEKLCQGIVTGHYNAPKTNNDGALNWAPGLPAEAEA